jgi:hypothetical protein
MGGIAKEACKIKKKRKKQSKKDKTKIKQRNPLAGI